MPQFIVKLLRSEFPLPQDLDLKIQLAHRSLGLKPQPEAPPRPIIIQLCELLGKQQAAGHHERKTAMAKGVKDKLQDFQKRALSKYEWAIKQDPV